MLDSLINPVGEATDACDAEYKGHCAETLKPRSISQREMMFILHRAKEKLADNSKDVDCCDHD